MRIRNRRKGQAILESSIVIIALLLMIVGIVDFGQFLFFQQALTDRARAGARYAVANTYDVTAIKNVVMYDSPNAPVGSTTGLYGLLASHVNVIPTPSAAAPTRIEVNITGFPIIMISPYLYKGALTVKPIRAVRQAEGLGATN